MTCAPPMLSVALRRTDGAGSSRAIEHGSPLAGGTGRSEGHTTRRRDGEEGGTALWLLRVAVGSACSHCLRNFPCRREHNERQTLPAVELEVHSTLSVSTARHKYL